MGLSQGVIQPAMSFLLARWVPPQERSFLTSLVHAGMKLGIFLPTALSGLIMGRFKIGWQFMFHLFGAIGIFFFILWVALVSDSPKNNKFITEKEKEYLQKHIESLTNEEKQPFPWKDALTSKPVLVFILMEFGSDFHSYV